MISVHLRSCLSTFLLKYFLQNIKNSLVAKGPSMVRPWAARWIHGSHLATRRPYFSSTVNISWCVNEYWSLCHHIITSSWDISSHLTKKGWSWLILLPHHLVHCCLSHPPCNEIVWTNRPGNFLSTRLRYGLYINCFIWYGVNPIC